jgi:pyruvate kinase
MSYPLANDLKKGDTLLLDDGLLRLRVTAVAPPAIETIVEVGGPLSNNKGINVPAAKLQVSALTDKDRSDIEVAKEIGVDFIALSFVRSVYDVLQCKSLAGGIPVIAKIEKPEAIRFLPDIVEAADGVMVARGDLGVEMGSEKVPLAQKLAILLTNKAGKLVITATQMLDSMIRNPRPTRAEATDVANAILDGTDVLMLSGETAIGRYPVEAVQMMDVIAREVEGSSIYLALPEPESLGGPWTLPNACARAAASMSRSLNLTAIAVVTHRGRTVDLMSDYRPHAPILAITDNAATASRLALCWGALPVLGPGPGLSPIEASDRAEMLARTMLNAKSGDTLAIVLGSAQDTGEKSLNLRTLRDK